ncbi:hypothetical protein ACWOAH_02245 [Vagococcus vulneris]|uniref:Uncharacterized protein n=1 Tax=Vagococcus vulneris TaxID=1977869 RepID=A0A430A128_9ENTE|nr:hypothetical protein [Vagococcus vulneris]RSU00115.1 hypothetical protein CBF37_02105 [Vagococcus vulneris]
MTDIKYRYKATPKSEQETVIIFDRELNQWTITTDVPTHITKYGKVVDPEKSHFYKDSNDRVVYLSGVFPEDVNVSVRGKRKMTDEQRAQAAERMRTINNQKKKKIQENV